MRKVSQGNLMNAQNARNQLRKRINEIEVRSEIILGSKELDRDLVILSMVTGFVCALSSEELELLGFACKLDWGFRRSELDGEIVKTILLHELGYIE